MMGGHAMGSGSMGFTMGFGSMVVFWIVILVAFVALLAWLFSRGHGAS